MNSLLKFTPVSTAAAILIGCNSSVPPESKDRAREKSEELSRVLIVKQDPPPILSPHNREVIPGPAEPADILMIMDELEDFAFNKQLTVKGIFDNQVEKEHVIYLVSIRDSNKEKREMRSILASILGLEDFHNKGLMDQRYMPTMNLTQEIDPNSIKARKDIIVGHEDYALVSLPEQPRRDYMFAVSLPKLDPAKESEIEKALAKAFDFGLVFSLEAGQKILDRYGVGLKIPSESLGPIYPN